MSAAEIPDNLLDGLEVLDVDAWSLDVLEREAAKTADVKVLCLVGAVALRVEYDIHLEEYDD